MTTPFAISRLLELSGGFFVGDRNSWKEPHAIYIDSRDSTNRSLFVPLKGERTDGHLHIESALDLGASAVLIEKNWAETHGETLLDWSKRFDALFFPVEDTLKAMQLLASRHMRRFTKLQVVGVTGSNGKTTTKEMIAAILGTMGRCYKNLGNLNSEIGLPLTVLRMNREYDFAVLEMGINHVGEMDILVDIARPRTAVVTNIGTAHIGYLGSKRRIAEEKRKIFSAMDGEGNAFVYERESFKEVLAENLKGKLNTFGRMSLSELKDVKDLGLEGQEMLFTDCSIRLPLPGIHNLQNAMASIAVCRSLGADWDHVREGLESLGAVFGRSEILKGRIDIVQDCYNANPDSVMAAVKMLEDMPSRGRRILVLGDMLELGEESRSAHTDLGRKLVDSGLDYVFFFGPEMKAAAKAYASSGNRHFSSDDYTVLENEVLRYVSEGDLVLLKGSRGMELERLTGVLAKEPQKVL